MTEIAQALVYANVRYQTAVAAIPVAQAAHRQRLAEGREIHRRHLEGQASVKSVFNAQALIDAAMQAFDDARHERDAAQVALQAARAARCAELEPVVKAAVARRANMRGICADCERIIASLRGPIGEAEATIDMARRLGLPVDVATNPFKSALT